MLLLRLVVVRRLAALAACCFVLSVTSLARTGSSCTSHHHVSSSTVLRTIGGLRLVRALQTMVTMPVSGHQLIVHRRRAGTRTRHHYLAGSAAHRRCRRLHADTAMSRRPSDPLLVFRSRRRLCHSVGFARQHLHQLLFTTPATSAKRWYPAVTSSSPVTSRTASRL